MGTQRLSRRTAVVLLAALVVVAGAGAAVTTGLTARPGSQAAHAEARGLGRSAPVRLVIPALGVDAPVVPLRLDRGELPAPPRAAVAGWYERGTSPGEPGSAVLVGHTGGDRGGPAVFARLGRLMPDDPITVWRADGTAARFAVDRVERSSGGRRYGGGGGEVSLRLVPAYRGGPSPPPVPVVFATLAP